MKLRNKILLAVAALFIILNFLIWITGTTYVYNAFYYFTADIDDYEIFHNRRIKKGEAQPWKISERYNTLPFSKDLSNTLARLDAISFLVIHKDSLVTEWYGEPFRKNSYSNSFSMAKTIVGILTGVALKEGKIRSLDQPIGDYLPEFNEGEKRKVTIRHLLMMSSGLNWKEVYISPVSHTTEAYYGNNLRHLIQQLDVVKEPGSEFSYKSGDTQIMAFVLEKATGKTLSEYTSEKLWKPLGAHEDALWSLDHDDGMEKAYCCFNSNARDFARIGQLYLNKGKWNDNQIVTEEYVQNSLTPIMLKNPDDEVVNYYGYFWWLIPEYEEKVYYARGIMGQYVIVLPERDLVLVRLGYHNGSIHDHHFADIFVYIDWAMEAFPKKQQKIESRQ